MATLNYICSPFKLISTSFKQVYALWSRTPFFGGTCTCKILMIKKREKEKWELWKREGEMRMGKGKWWKKENGKVKYGWGEWLKGRLGKEEWLKWRLGKGEYGKGEYMDRDKENEEKEKGIFGNSEWGKKERGMGKQNKENGE